MSKEDEEGTRGSDEGAGVEIALDDFVARIVRDPNDPPDLLLLSGYLGASNEEAHVRLYLDEELSRYVEIPLHAIRHTQELEPDQSPLGGSLVWIERKAEVLHGKVGTERQRASFLEGQIAQDYIGGGGGVAAEGFPAAVGGRVAIPDSSRANPNCTFFGPRCRKTFYLEIECTNVGLFCGISVYPNVCETEAGPPACPPPVETIVGPRCESRLPSDRNCPKPDTEFDRRCPTNDVLCTIVSPCVYTEAKCWGSGYRYCPNPNLRAQAGQQGVGQQGFARGAEGFAAGGEVGAAFPPTRFCISEVCPSQPCFETSAGGLLCTIIGPTCPTMSGPDCPRTLFNPPCPPTVFGPPCPPSQFFPCPSEFGQFCPPTPVLVCPSQVQDPNCITMQGPGCVTDLGPNCGSQFQPQCPTTFCAEAVARGGGAGGAMYPSVPCITPLISRQIPCRPPENPFIRQHYLDFLRRDPTQSGCYATLDCPSFGCPTFGCPTYPPRCQ